MLLDIPMENAPRNNVLYKFVLRRPQDFINGFFNSKCTKIGMKF